MQIHCLEKLALLLERNEDEVNRCCVPCWRASEQFASKRPVDWRIDRVNREAASFCIACRSPPQSGRHLAEGLSMWGRLKMELNGLHNLWLVRAITYIYRKWTSWEKCQKTKQPNSYSNEVNFVELIKFSECELWSFSKSFFLSMRLK